MIEFLFLGGSMLAMLAVGILVLWASLASYPVMTTLVLFFFFGRPLVSKTVSRLLGTGSSD